VEPPVDAAEATAAATNGGSKQMTIMKSCMCGLTLVTQTLLVVGCQAPQQRSDRQQIPQITRLVEKVTAAPSVHRFRKPLRDERTRILRQLATECDRLAADVQTWAGTAELTTADTQQQDMVQQNIRSLREALRNLRGAADSGDMRSVRSAHTAATTAYARIRDRMDRADLPGP
jgi:hypothetical protein